MNLLFSSEYVNLYKNKTDEIHIITRNDFNNDNSIDNINENVFVHKILNKKIYTFQLIKYINQINPDLIDLQLSYSGSSRFSYINPSMNLFSFFYRINNIFKRNNIKILITVHELLRAFPKDSKIKKIYRNFREFPTFIGVDAVQSLLEEKIDNEYQRIIKKIKVKNKYLIFPPANITEKIEINSESNKEKNILNITFFGTVTEKKNIEFIIDVFNSLKYENKILNIIGKYDKRYKENLEKKIKIDNINNIKFYGALDVSEIKKIFNKTDFALFAFKEKITTRNASVLLPLVMGVKTIIYTDYAFEYLNCSYLYRVNELNLNKFIKLIKENKNITPKNIINNNDLVKNNVKERFKMYYDIIGKS